MTYLGMQIMVEGLALAAFGFMYQLTEEPLLKQLLRYVMSDEARHVAFGVLSLKEYYAELSDAELRERQEFAFEAAVRMRDRFLQQEVWERMGVDTRQMVKILFDAPADQLIFQQMLFSKIVPNCKKLGLLDASGRLAAPPLRGDRRDPVRGLGRHRRGVPRVRRRVPGSSGGRRRLTQYGGADEHLVDHLVDHQHHLGRLSLTAAGRLDVHAHFVPEGYRQAALAAGHGQPDGMVELPAWTAEAHLELMDRLGIATALLSISSPGVWFGDAAAARALARQVNDEGGHLVGAHPGRFGLLASLPLPDVDASRAEIGHAIDDLGADGFVLLTNVDGTYLGDPALEPIFDELDRRHARVLLHPTSPVCWEHTSLGRPRPMLEFLFDTTRAVVNLVLNGTVARHPNVELIVPHAGAALPVIADRVAAFALVLADVDDQTRVLEDLARLHYDLAGFPVPRQLDAILALTTLEHLHYGSDFPFTPGFVVEMGADALDPVGQPPGSLVEALVANTRRLFPEVGGVVSR